jgi:iron complex outermembrane receptor protein
MLKQGEVRRRHGVRQHGAARLLSALLMASSALPAMAQEAAAEEETTEIVVTAQRREQSLLQVPVSVAVVSGSALEANRISGIEDLQVLAPSLSFTNSANSRGQGLSVRGIGTLNFSDGVEPSVSTVIDGVVIGRQAQSVFDFIDIDRIEILRGPQGTLFGKNSSAGVIHIVTQKPDLTKAGFTGSASYGDLNELRLRGSVSVPLIEGKLAARLTAYHVTRDGPITNIANGQDLNNQKQWGLRGKLLFAPSDDLDVLLIGDFARIDRDCCVWTARTTLPTTRYFGASGPLRTTLLGPITPGPANRQVNIDAPSFINQDSWGLSAEANWRLGDHTLTAITAYRRFSLLDNNDADTVPVDLLNLNNADQGQRQFTQELRLASDAEKPLSYVVGLFWFDQALTTRTEVAGTFGAVLPAGARLGSLINRSVDTRNIAGFADLTFRASDRVRLIAGARLTNERLTASFARSNLAGAIAAAPTAGAALPATAISTNDTDLSYRLVAQFDASRDLMLYASHNRGYKGVAINMLNNLSAALIASGEAVLRPEIATSYELGARAALIDRSLLLNLTGFWSNFEDFQAQGFNAALASFILDNAGRLRTRGVEAELIYTPVKRLNLSVNAAYTDATIRSYFGQCFPGQTAAQGCVGTGAQARQDLSGARVPNAPRWSISASAGYEQRLDDRLSLFLGGTMSYRSAVNFSLNQDPNTVQPGYTIVNANIGVGPSDGGWRVSAFARNLFNRNFASLIFATPLDGGAAASGYSQILTDQAQRVAGVVLDVKF